MALKTDEDPVTQARHFVAESRLQFAKDVDAIMGGLSMELRSLVLERFEEYLPMRRLGDPVLLQLIREAYDHFENPESTVDIRAWIKEARKIVGGGR